MTSRVVGSGQTRADCLESRLGRLWWPLSSVVMALWLITPVPAFGATFVVNSTLDLVDVAPGNGLCATVGAFCTLRAAVQEANALAGADVITLPPGTYTLTIAGRGEFNAATGDLNVRTDITISGSGSGTTIIDAAGLDRVFRGASPGNLKLNDLTIQNGDPGPEASSFGGGVYMISGTSLTVTRSVIRANTSVAGGGIAIVGNASPSVLTVTDTMITQNVSSGAGGGLHFSNGTSATLSRTIVAGNSAGTTGGGIWMFGGPPISTLTISDTTIANNVAMQFSGGGVEVVTNTNSSTVAVHRSTISGNSSSAFGGGLSVDGTVVIDNTTISGNTSATSTGGIYQVGGTLTLMNVTIASDTGMASLLVRGITQVKNSIVAGTCGSFNTLTSLGNNLEFPGTTCGFSLPSDLRADPLLGPLANNGGPTQTRALPPNSPAVDAGDDATCAAPPVSGVDQRGFARAVGLPCDMGAYETGGGPLFTDDPLISGTTLIRAIHFDELRGRINALRVRFGLQPFAWTDAILTGITVSTVHIEQLREALIAAYLAAIGAGVNVTLPSFIDNPLVPQQTPARTIHIEQLRAAVLVLEGT